MHNHPQEMTQQQTMLVYWLDFYDWVTGPNGPSPKPSKEIIDNDRDLDDFIETWKDNLNKNSSGSKTTNRFEIA